MAKLKVSWGVKQRVLDKISEIAASIQREGRLPQPGDLVTPDNVIDWAMDMASHEETVSSQLRTLQKSYADLNARYEELRTNSARLGRGLSEAIQERDLLKGKVRYSDNLMQTAAQVLDLQVAKIAEQDAIIRGLTGHAVVARPRSANRWTI